MGGSCDLRADRAPGPIRSRPDAVSQCCLAVKRLTGRPSRAFWGRMVVERLLGYTRGSTTSQDARLQLDALTAAGVETRDVFTDVTSGSRRATDRPGDGDRPRGPRAT